MKMGVKILIAVVAVLVLVIAGALIWYFTTINCIKKVHTPNEAAFGTGDMRALVIYEPSKHDTTKDMSTLLAETLADNGFTVTVNYPSSQLAYRWEDYDIIALGSPVYVKEVSPVLKEYVLNNPIEGKRIILFATGFETDETLELAEMASWVSSNNSVVSIKVSKDDGERLVAFIKENL